MAGFCVELLTMNERNYSEILQSRNIRDQDYSIVLNAFPIQNRSQKADRKQLLRSRLLEIELTVYKRQVERLLSP